MFKKDIAVVKSMMRGDACPVSSIKMCYVDAQGERRFSKSKSFAIIEEDAAMEYQTLFSKALSGTLGKNLTSIDFPFDEESAGGKQAALMELLEGSDDVAEILYDKIIKGYTTDGAYCIGYDDLDQRESGVICNSGSAFDALCHGNAPKYLKT